MRKMRHLDLFSGIGGFSLAASWVWGEEHEIVAFCEIDKFCQKVLKKHWPNVPIIKDVRGINGNEFKNIQLITGGFPCQDLSASGKKKGIEGNRSGLWGELCRIISQVRPQYAIVENVPNLLMGERGEWFGKVLSDLASIGFDAEWHCLSAKALGGEHSRNRVWLVTYPNSKQFQNTQKRLHTIRLPKCLDAQEYRLRSCESPILGSDNGIPNRVDRLRSLGNAIVPQVAAIIMQAIREAGI